MKTKIVAALLSATLMAGSAYAAVQDGPTPIPADRNSDGIVTRDEALAAAEARFANLDKDNDGKLTGAELRAAFMPRGMSQGGEGRRARMLERFDADKDGKLNDAEREKARESFRGARAGGSPRLRGPRTSGLADRNQDGVVTQDEVKAEMLARFERSDTNKDGRLDQTERDAERARMRGPRGPGMAPPPSPPADGPATASGT